MPGLAALTHRHVLPSILAASLLASPAALTRAQAPVEPPAAPAAHHPPLSAASAVLVIEPRRAPDGSAIPESDAQLQRRIQTHVATIASEHHMRRVVNAEVADVRRTQWFRESSDVVERAAWLRDHCRVAAVPGTSLIEIALPDVKDAADRKTILEAVGNEYLRVRSDLSTDVLKDRTAVLIGLRDKAKSRLTALVMEKQQAQLRLNSDGAVGGRLGAKEIELSKLVGEQIEAARKASKAQADYDSIQAAIREGRPVPGEGNLNQVAPFLQDEEKNLQQLEVELALSRDQVGPNNPRVLALEKRLQVMRSAHEKKKEGARAALASTRAAIAEQARAEAAASKAAAESMGKRVEQLKGELGDLSNAMLTLLSLNEEERGLREQIKLVQEQIDKVVGSSTGASDVQWHLLPQVANP